MHTRRCILLRENHLPHQVLPCSGSRHTSTSLAFHFRGRVGCLPVWRYTNCPFLIRPGYLFTFLICGTRCGRQRLPSSVLCFFFLAGQGLRFTATLSGRGNLIQEVTVFLAAQGLWLAVASTQTAIVGQSSCLLRECEAPLACMSPLYPVCQLSSSPILHRFPEGAMRRCHINDTLPMLYGFGSFGCSIPLRCLSFALSKRRTCHIITVHLSCGQRLMRPFTLHYPLPNAPCVKHGVCNETVATV